MSIPVKILSLILSVVIILGTLPIFSVVADDNNVEIFDVTIATGVGTSGDSADKCYFPEIVFIPLENLPDEQKSLYPEGKLIAVYFCHWQHVTNLNNTDVNAYGDICMTTSGDSGKTWSKPKTFLTPEWAIEKGLATADSPREPRDPVLFLMDEGKTLVATFPIGAALGGSKSYYITSTDAGETWSEPLLFDCTYKTPNGDIIPYFVQNYQPAIFSNGDVLFPFYTDWSNKDANGNHLWQSYHTFGILYRWDSESKTFIKNTEADGTPCEFRLYDYDETDSDGNKINQAIMSECSMVATNNPENPGQVFAFSREHANFYESLDYGKTWKCITTERTLSGGIVQPYLTPLPDGSIMLSYAMFRSNGNGDYVSGRWIYAKRFYPDLGYNATETKLIYKNDLEMGYAATALLADGETMIVVSYDVEHKAIIGNFINISDFAPSDSVGRFCGFENYPQGDNVTHYNSDVSSVDFSEYHSGIKSFKTTLQEKGITAFEVRDRYPVEIAKDTEYTINFFYKSDKSMSVYAGLGTKENLKDTAYGLGGVELTATNEWKEASITFTPDKASSDGYSLAMLLYADNGSVIYIDDISVSFNESGETSSMAPIEFDDSWYPTLSVFANKQSSQSNVWDGSIAEGFSGGNGTSGDPYVITNGAELALAITKGGANEEYTGCYFTIMNDIYLNDINSVDWSTGKAKAGYKINTWYNQSETFAGTINGNGHVIYGLYYHEDGTIQWTSDTNAAALVPVVVPGGTATITDLGINNTYVRARYGAAAFVGLGFSTITNCFAGENVYITGRDAGAFVAKCITAAAKPITISNCYSLAKLDGIEYGIIAQGFQSWLSVKNCYILGGPITTHKYTNQWLNKYQFSNCYQTENNADGGPQSTYSNVVTIEDVNKMMGDDVLTASDKMVNLGAAFVVGKRDFAENDCLVYLPAGTNLGDDYKPTFYDFDMSVISNSEVISGYVMKRGAFVKFGIMPDETTVIVPAPFKAGTQLTAEKIKASADVRVPTPFDLNNDSCVDICDLVSLDNSLVGNKAITTDIDSNGKIDNDDMTKLRSKIIDKD